MLPGDFAADRRTAAAATACAGMRRSMVVHSIATDGRSASKCQGKWSDQPSGHRSGGPMRWSAVLTSRLSCWKAGNKEIFTPVFESIWGIRNEMSWRNVSWGTS